MSFLYLLLLSSSMIPHTQKHQSWFTLIELLWAMLIISIALLSIFTLLRVAIDFTNKSRQETIAINLAREGVEAVYQRRNTNRLRWSNERDTYRLCEDNACANWLQWWKLYSINTLSWSFTSIGAWTTDNSLLTWNWSNQGQDWSTNNQSFIIDNDDFLWWQSPDAAARFYRAIIGVWLYQKDTNVEWWNLISCAHGADNYNGIDIDWSSFPWECSDSRPKEFQFCSRVEYERNDQTGQVELCSAITNYRQ